MQQLQSRLKKAAAAKIGRPIRSARPGTFWCFFVKLRRPQKLLTYSLFRSKVLVVAGFDASARR
jgi:hypothetical protein